VDQALSSFIRDKTRLDGVAA